MNITLGIYSIVLFFFYIIVPGYIFRRFYYHGEFSKELNTKNHHLQHLIYSSFTGIVIVFLFTSLLNCSEEISIDYNHFLVKFHNKFIKEEAKEVASEIFFKDNSELYVKYLPFLLSLYGISITFGYLISKVIILLKIDTYTKVLRFKNEWYYIFNGKFLRFKKKNTFSKLKVKYTFLDVLVRTENESPILYSGLLADYELCHNNISKIERIHLLKAVRRENQQAGIIRKTIPGNVFTILGENIININCTYIFYNSTEIKLIKFENWGKVVVFLQLLTLLIIAFFFVTIVIMKISVFDFDLLKIVTSKSLWFRLLSIYSLNVFLGLVTPVKMNRNNLKIEFLGWHAVFLKIIFLVILFSILFFNRY